MELLPEEMLEKIFHFSGSYCYNCKFVCRDWFRINCKFDALKLFEACLKEQNIARLDEFASIWKEFIYSSQMLEVCIEGSLLSSLEWLLEKEKQLQRSIYPIAVRLERMDVLEWADQRKISIQAPTQNPYRFALEKKNLKILDWLFDHQCPWEQHCYIPAISSNSVKILDWLEQKGIFSVREFQKYPYTTIAPLTEVACGWGSLESLKWLSERRMYITGQCSYLASKSEHLQILDWLRINLLLDSDKAFTAAYQLNLDSVINYLESFGLAPGNSTICVMIEQNRVQEVEKFTKGGFVLDSVHFSYMVEHDRLEIMKILFKQNGGKIPEICLEYLIRKRRQDLLDWLIRERNVSSQEIQIVTCKLCPKFSS